MRKKLTPGDPFPCPKCGDSDNWRAWYYDPTNQGVKLVVGQDGGPEETDWYGDGGHDGDCTETDCYQCTCGHLLHVAEFIMAPVGQDTVIKELLAAYRKKNRKTQRMGIERALRRLDRLNPRKAA